MSDQMKLDVELVIQIGEMLATLPYAEVHHTIQYLAKAVYDHQQSQEPKIFTGE